MFIELTSRGENRTFMGNLNLLQRVIDKKGFCTVIGWNNNGGFDVNETYSEIQQKIRKAQNAPK